MNSRGLKLTTLILIICGLIILSSSAVIVSYENYQDNYYYLKHQLLFGVLVGFIGFFIAKRIPTKQLKILALPILLTTLLLTIAVFFEPFGLGYQGAKRWLQIGNFSFQPSEFLKISLVIYLAAWLEKKQHLVRNISTGFLPFIVILAVISILLAAQPDIGTLIIILTTSALMFFSASYSRISHVLLFILTGIASILILIKIAPYRINRIITFLNPEADPLGISYQMNQAILAIGSGGPFGTGLGQGRQKFNYLPEPFGDSIFAIAAEETGFAGAMIIIFLFLIFCWFGYKISKNASTEFDKLLGFGLTTWITMQAAVNIAAISGLIPLTGIPLPFISFGGTSLAVAITSVGIISNIAKKQ